jgi:hypothetical protein
VTEVPQTETGKQLELLRAEELRTHKQRRLTNWIVVCVAVVSMIFSGGVFWQNHRDDQQILDRQTQQRAERIDDFNAVLSTIHKVCLWEENEASREGQPFTCPPLIVLPLLPPTK